MSTTGVPKLFVSYSSRDEAAVQMLFFALRLQRVGVWDYTKEGEHLPLGQFVTESLADKIGLCDYFLAVVSANSTDEVFGCYTDFEVRRAVEGGLLGRRRLLPVLLATSPPASWRGAYAGLEGLLRVELDCSEQRRFDDAVRKICEYIAVDYVPPVLGDPRVFFSRRVREEMAGQRLSTADYMELMDVVVGCAEKVTLNAWEEAGRLISLFLTLSAFKLPGVSLYYPQIVKGVCELQAGSFEAAEQTFAQATQHPAGDENAFGGLGQAYFYQGRYAEALVAFRKSFELKPTDKGTRFNLEAARLHAGAPDGAANAASDLECTQLSPGDRVKVNKLKGIALLRQGKCREATEVFGRMAERQELDAAAVIYYYRALESCGRRGEALRLLRREAGRRDDINIHHHLADAYLKADMVYEALCVYEDKLSRPGCPRKYLVEHARILKAIGGAENRAKVVDICSEVLGRADAPLTAEDFYYAGFANYLLGDYSRARYDYERSGRFYGYYDQFE